MKQTGKSQLHRVESVTERDVTPEALGMHRSLGLNVSDVVNILAAMKKTRKRQNKIY